MTKISNASNEALKMSDVLANAIDKIKKEKITLRDLMELVGEQGLLMVCALLCLPFLFPVSIPGVSTVFGAGIILISVAITLNKLPWLPRFIIDKQIESQKLIPVLKRGVNLLKKIDKYLKPRISFFSTDTMNRINGLAIMFAGVLLMMPLGLIPFSNTLPAVAILFLAIGISQRDGLLILLGYFMILMTLVYFGALAYGAFLAGKTVIS